MEHHIPFFYDRWGFFVGTFGALLDLHIDVFGDYFDFKNEGHSLGNPNGSGFAVDHALYTSI